MNRYQQGVGLVEVMVSLLLLAGAVLGFSALQMQAVNATDESLVRSRATSVISSLAEAMRNNINEQKAIKEVFDGTTSLDTIPNCLDNSTSCNATAMAQFAAKEIKNQATKEEFSVNVAACPGTTAGRELYCAIVAWGDTQAELDNTRVDTATKKTNCAKENGVYHKGSTCLIMETY